MARPLVQTIERLPSEGARAYEARVEYVTMGPQRSLDAVAQKYNKSRSLFARWSTEYDWQATAIAWDNQQAAALQQQAAEQYRADLEAHRKKAMDASQNLIVLAAQLAKAMDSALKSPRTIEGKDGKFYKLHNIEITSSTLTTLAKSFTTALDLEAHALGVDQLLPTLTNDDSE